MELTTALQSLVYMLPVISIIVFLYALSCLKSRRTNFQKIRAVKILSGYLTSMIIVSTFLLVALGSRSEIVLLFVFHILLVILSWVTALRYSE